MHRPTFLFGKETTLDTNILALPVARLDMHGDGGMRKTIFDVAGEHFGNMMRVFDRHIRCHDHIKLDETRNAGFARAQAMETVNRGSQTADILANPRLFFGGKAGIHEIA